MITERSVTLWIAAHLRLLEWRVTLWIATQLRMVHLWCIYGHAMDVTQWRVNTVKVNAMDCQVMDGHTWLGLTLEGHSAEITHHEQQQYEVVPHGESPSLFQCRCLYLH